MVTAAQPVQCYLGNTTTTNSSWHYSCDEKFYDLHDWIFFYLAVTSHVFLLFLSRRARQKYSHICSGRPGIIFPMNMLDGCENRLAYCAAFGAMTFELTSILWNPYGRFTSFGLGYQVKNNALVSQYPSLRVLLLLGQVGVCTYLFSPLFYALATSYKFIGAIIGIVISLFKFTVMIWLSSCLDIEQDIFSAGFKVKKYMLAILLWPCIACLGILCFRYIIIAIDCISRRQLGLYTLKDQSVAQSHHIEHVRYLLRKGRLPWSEQNLQHLSLFSKERFLANFAFRRIPGFKFPTRVLATFTITVLAVYQVGVQVVFQVYSGLKVIRRYIRCAKVLFPPVVNNLIGPYSDKIYGYANIAANMWVVCFLFTMLLGVVYVYHMCLCYRKHTFRIYRGDMALFPKNWVRESNHNVLTCASRHAGLQIAYTIWGLIIIQVCLFLSLSIIVFVIIIPAADFQVYSILRWILNIVLITLLLNQVIYWTQILLNRYLFLQDKINPTDAKPPLALDNRNGWYNLSFFFFFWNLFLGVISALMRIFKGLVLGVFFIPRIDRPVLMRGFETMDSGFYSYLSLLSVINSHDHPVVKVFTQILIDSIYDRPVLLNVGGGRVPPTKATADGASNETLENGSSSNRFLSRRTTPPISRKARWHWLIAYTLIHNPDLIDYRKVSADDTDTADGLVRRHRISIAIHKKNHGERTSDFFKSV